MRSSHRVAARFRATHASGILSAFTDASQDVNARQHARLLADLARLGYGDVTAYTGVWEGAPERAVLVSGIRRADLLDLGRKYGQKAVVFDGAMLNL